MSNRIPQTFINELLTRVDIVELIESRVTLKKTGSNYAACCPFHTEKTPSFTVSPSKQFYYCFGCSAHGNAIGFLMAYDRMEFMDAVESLAKQAGLTIPIDSQPQAEPSTDFYAILEKAADYYKKQLYHAETAKTYLKNRGLSGEIAKLYGLGFAPSGWDNLLKHLATSPHIIDILITTGMLIKSGKEKIYDRFRDRILFPIRDVRGRVIGFGGRTLGNDTPKYLNSPETPIYHKGSELYGLYEARLVNKELNRVLVVEGYMDVIALAQHGITNVVATLGTATSSKHLQKLFRYTQEIIFCFDGDAAGQRAAWRALEISLPLMHDGLEIRFMFLPQNDDPDSLIRKESIEQFKQRINAATPLSKFFFDHLSQQTQLNSLDGKAKLASLAKNLLAKMPNGIFQQLMLERLSQIIGTQVNDKLSARQTREPSIPYQVENNLKGRTPIRLAITLLLQHPELAKSIQCCAALQNVDLPGMPLLIRLIELLQAQPMLTTGNILEYWRDQDEAKQLAKLAMKELVVPPLGAQQELADILLKIKQHWHDSQIKRLLTKANEQGLVDSEKQALLKLLADRQS